MTTFLFWNLNRKPLQASVARLARLYDVDVVMLAEGQFGPNDLLHTFSDDLGMSYQYAPGNISGNIVYY